MSLWSFHNWPTKLVPLLRVYSLFSAGLYRSQTLGQVFTASAVERAASSQYNPETGEVETEEDQLLDSIDDSPDDMMFDLSEFLSAHNSTATLIGSTEPTKPPPSSTAQTSERPSVVNIGVGDLLGSSDSVSTFQTNAKQSAPNSTINSSRPTTSSAPPAPVSVAASQSSLTTITRSEFYSQQSQLEDLGNCCQS